MADVLKERVSRARKLYEERKARHARESLIRAARRHYHLLLHRLHLRNLNQFHPWMLNGHPGNITQSCKNLIPQAIRLGLVVTATTDGVHAPNSYHYKGMAVDFGTRSGGDRAKKVKIQRYLYNRSVKYYHELYGPDDVLCAREGQNFVLTHGSALERQHESHTHVAPY